MGPPTTVVRWGGLCRSESSSALLFLPLRSRSQNAETTPAEVTSISPRLRAGTATQGAVKASPSER